MADRSWKALLAEVVWLQDAWPERVPPLLVALAEKAKASPQALRVVLDGVAGQIRPAWLAAFADDLAGHPTGTEGLRQAALRLQDQGRWREAMVFHDALDRSGDRAGAVDLLAHARCLEQLGEAHRAGPLLQRLAEATAADPQQLQLVVDAVADGGPEWIAVYVHALAGANALLLTNVAKRLEQRARWPAVGMVLGLFHRSQDTPWKIVLGQMARLEARGGGAAAVRLVPLLADAALASPHGYKVIADTVARRGIAGWTRVFASEVAARSRRQYLATLRRWARTGNPQRQAWLEAAPPPGVDHDSWALSLAAFLEGEGQDALADGLVAGLQRAPLQAELGPEATPTASTLLYRNPALLESLAVAIRERLASHRPVDVHVAAVSSGEEAYSLAAFLDARGLLDACTLGASDYSPDLLAQARTGRVDAAALQSLTAEARRGFARDANGWKLRPDLLARIAFAPLDLLEETGDAPGARYDVFIANNVLVHYPPRQQAEIVRHIAARLAPGGIACIGGQTNDGIREALLQAGLAPWPTDARKVYEGWALQRRAWYQARRPYWALPPYRPEAGGEWRFATFFAKPG